jgi:hypothetical protein
MCEGGKSEKNTLLREIRDLQRGHFEQYKQFTAAALGRQEEAIAIQQQSANSAAQVRQENQQFREEVQKNAADARHLASRAQAVMWISVSLNALLVFALVYALVVLLWR